MNKILIASWAVMKAVLLLLTFLAVFTLLLWGFTPAYINRIDRCFVKLYTAHYESFLNEAKAEIQKGEIDKGIKALDTLLQKLANVKKLDRLDTVKRDCMENLINAYMETKKHEKVITLYDSWIEHDDRNIFAKVDQAKYMLELPGYKEKGESLLTDLYLNIPIENVVNAYISMQTKKGPAGLAKAYCAFQDMLNSGNSRWRIYWDTGKGFNKRERMDVRPFFFKGSILQANIKIPAKIKQIRIDPPPYSNFYLVKPEVSLKTDSGIKNVVLSGTRLETNQILKKETIDNLYLVLSGEVDPYFYFLVYTSYLDEKDNLSFKTFVLPAFLIDFLDNDGMKDKIKNSLISMGRDELVDSINQSWDRLLKLK